MLIISQAHPCVNKPCTRVYTCKDKHTHVHTYTHSHTYTHARAHMHTHAHLHNTAHTHKPANMQKMNYFLFLASFSSPSLSRTQWKKCTFSGDGEFIVAGSHRQHALYIWDKGTGSLAKMLTGQKGETLLDIAVSGSCDNHMLCNTGELL